ncbi:hypothetical protein [Sphingobium phenoxybenzoativorans]|uniref:hypothetical protein n=1 Tax=Sphingobium phenoxybenzoativorans TaxID=1592790 RepID=UPI0008725F82|nr:hypothetical protein [Sphingobium phenoxybenzoativorans]
MFETTNIGTAMGEYDLKPGTFTSIIFAAGHQVRFVTICEIIINGTTVAKGVTADYMGDNPSISPQTICALIPYSAKAKLRISNVDAGSVVVNAVPLGLLLEQPAVA